MSIYSTTSGLSGIPIYPTTADFPSVGVPGQQVVAANTNTIYIWDNGSMSWVAIANAGAAVAIDQLTGDVTATGPGVVTATVAKIGGTSVVGSTGNTNVVFSNSPTLSGTINLSSLTASQILALDGSSNIQSLSTATYPSLLELSYLKGTTSSVQTQLNNKQPIGQLIRITKSANYNLATSDEYIGCNTTVASLTLTLPSASLVPNGKEYIVKDEGGNATAKPIYIAPSGADKIDNVNATVSIYVSYESLSFVCNGVDGWYLI